jgi:hypothetical protein
MTRHHLVRRVDRSSLPKVVSDVCGIQAQVLSAAELAIRARVEGIGQQDVRDALWKHHTILKTWCMRGSLHLLASADLPVFVAALRTKLTESEDWLERDGGVLPSEVDAVVDSTKLALKSQPMTRMELSRFVERHAKLTPKTRDYLMSAWGVLLRPSAYQGLLAFGPNVGPKVTFVRPDKWIANWKEPAAKEAFRMLYLRFLGSYGPATVAHFAHWWGDLRKEERSFLESEREGLEEVRIDGILGLMRKADAKEASRLDSSRVVRLLPSFDCYVMFYLPRDLFVSKAHRRAIFRKTAGWNYPALVIDGIAAGVWNIKKRVGRIEIEVESFRVLEGGEKEGIEREAADIGRFLDFSASVRVLSASSGRGCSRGRFL